MEAQRKLLDELLGKNRNGDRKVKPLTHHSDKRVCKFHLAGVCPYKLFPNTKHDLGPCPHEFCPPPDFIIEQYKQEVSRGEFPGYEDVLLPLLENLVREADDRIRRIKMRLESAMNAARESNPELTNAMVALTQKESLALQAGEAGQVEEAAKLMAEVESMRTKVHQLRASMPKIDASKEALAIVCDDCGAQLSALDADERLNDHLYGRVHKGYCQIRKMVPELREKVRQMRFAPNPAFERGREREADRRERYMDSADRDRERDERRRTSYRDYDRPPGDDRRRDDRHGDRDRYGDRYGGDRDRDRGGRYGGDRDRYGGDRDRSRY